MIPIFDIADPAAKRHLMLETIQALESRPDVGFVLLHLVAAFIDGLAAGAKGDTKAAYIRYLQANFPALCPAIGAEVFYSHIRSKAVHEFALPPPLALAHAFTLKDSNDYVETVTRNGQELMVVNLERIVADFRSHLGAAGASSQ